MFPSPILRSEFVFERAPTPSCHASSLVETKSGELLCAWFGGTHEGANDVGIYVSQWTGAKWAEPTEVAVGLDKDGNQIPCWNPVLFSLSSGQLLLFYRVGRSIPNWKGFFKVSSDEGRSWSKETELPHGILGPIKNKPVELSTGRILSGSSEELGGWRVHFEYSDDEGKTWKRTKSVNAPGVIGAIQPAILEESGGTVVAVGRTQQHKVFRIVSRDYGETWEKMQLTEVDNPNSGIDAVRLKSGKYLLVYNNSTAKRTPLTIALSSDTVHWIPVATIEHSAGELSYPAVIQTRDGLVHTSYTWKRQKIKHVIIDPTLLPSKIRTKS